MEADFSVPVVIVVYKRPALAARVLERVAQIKPRKLFIIADGPKPEDDAEAIKQTRAIFDQVSWPCEVSRNFAEKNMGLRERIESGLDWVFDQVDRAIILEDDCVPHPDFFKFSQDMLAKYAEDPTISMVSGDNAHGYSNGASFYCSRYTLIWGWATWARAWKRYNHGMTWWPAMRDSHFLYDMFKSRKAARYWTTVLEDNYKGANSWARVWMMTNWLEESLCAVSCVNQISNIGFGEDATHTAKRNAIRSYAQTEAPLLPLRPPARLVADDLADSIGDRVIFSRDDAVFKGDGATGVEVEAAAAHRFLAGLGLPARARMAMIAHALRRPRVFGLAELRTGGGARKLAEALSKSNASALEREAASRALSLLGAAPEMGVVPQAV